MVAKQVLVLAVAAVTGSPVAWAQQSSEQLPSGLREAVIDATYAVGRAEGQTWTASNPAQGMRSTFTAEEGVRIEGSAGEGAWGLSLELEAWGRSGALIPVQAVEPVAVGRRAEYRRGPLTEWYVNDARGLEQGFTIDEQPAGEGAIEIALAVGQGFAAEVRPGERDALFIDRSTGSVLHYSGLRAWDASQRELEASLSVIGNRLSILVEDEQAVYPVQIDPWIATEEAKLTASDAAAGDILGVSIAISGDTAVVGAYRDDHAGGLNAGSAYVFVRTGTIWSEQQKLTASNAAKNDYFGYSVAVDGDTAVVGAILAGGMDAGSAYVFVRTETIWSEQQRLSASDSSADDSFGNCVAVSGDTAVVGAYGDDDAGLLSGSAYVFVRTGTSWSEQQKLTASDATEDDRFGWSVSVSGDTAVVGAYGDDDAGLLSGSAYVFVRTGASWSEQQKLTASDATEDDRFGWSVSVSGDTAVVGAYGDDDAGLLSGSAYVFVQSGTVWSEEAKLVASDSEDGDYFGWCVSASGDTAVVGAWFDDHAGGTDAGSAYVFVQSGTAWSEVAKLVASDSAVSDQFGYSVAVSGNTAVVGAVFDDHTGGVDAGSAYVFRLYSTASTYCTAGTSASGCQALLSASGTASATAPSGFTLSAAGVEGQKDGLFFFGTNGQQANPWGNGTSYQCVVPPVKRAPIMTGTGTIGLCDGSFALDLNALWCPTCPKPGHNPGAGVTVQAQLWYRDPASTSNQTTSLSDAIEFGVGL